MTYQLLICVIILFFNTSSFASDELHIQKIINFNNDTSMSIVKSTLGSEDFIYDSDNNSFVKKDCGKLSEMKFLYDNNELNIYNLDVRVLDDYSYVYNLHNIILQAMCNKFGIPDKVVSFDKNTRKRKEIKFDKTILDESLERRLHLMKELDFIEFIIENDIYYYWSITDKIRSCLSMTEPKSLKFNHAYYE